MVKTQMALIIRQATFRDQKKIFAFLGEVYGPLSFFKYPERWHWLFKENPFCFHSKPCIWIALIKRKIVGQFCGMHISFKLGKKCYSAIWGVDFIVRPECRGQTIGRQLLKVILQNHPYLFALWASPASSHLFSLFGAEVPVHISVFERASTSVSFFKKNRKKHEIKIQPISKFGPEIDHLWRKESRHYYGLVKRSATYLNWKFLKQPDVCYHAFIAKVDNYIRGYILLRKPRPPEKKGLIADLFASPKDVYVMMALLNCSIEYFRKERIHSILAAASIKSYADALTKLGFKKRSEMPLFVLTWGKTKKIFGKKVWLFNRGDSDWDQYPWVGSRVRN